MLNEALGSALSENALEMAQRKNLYRKVRQETAIKFHHYFKIKHLQAIIKILGLRVLFIMLCFIVG